MLVHGDSLVGLIHPRAKKINDTKRRMLLATLYN